MVWAVIQNLGGGLVSRTIKWFEDPRKFAFCRDSMYICTESDVNTDGRYLCYFYDNMNVNSSSGYYSSNCSSSTFCFFLTR